MDLLPLKKDKIHSQRMDISSLVHHIRQYVSLADDEAPILRAHFNLVEVKKKTNLLIEGQICKASFFVEKGCLRQFFIDKKGNEQITQFAIENWWMADYMSLGKQAPSSFYIQAVEPTILWSLGWQAQEKLLHALPQMERYFRLILQQAYAASQLRLKYLYDLSREELYYHFSSQFPAFMQRIPQYMLASFLGFTPEYLSEIRKKEANINR